VAPPYPIVVGQDPERRGADLLWQVEVPPVVHTWYSEEEIRECVRVGSGGRGCNDSDADGYRSFMRDNPAYALDVDIECIRHTDVYPDPLASVTPRASLTPESRDWITSGGLQARYPGASLYQPDWVWFPPVDGSVLANGAFVWEFLSERNPFRDPGGYSFSIGGSTKGTPVSSARRFEISADGFSVWLLEATLSK
jgi:hypothetical protein